MSTVSLWQSLGYIFISWGCYNKVPQTGWLKTREICPLLVLEARRVKSRCSQGYTLSGGPGKVSSRPPSSSGAD